MEETFTRIFQENIWRCSESASGYGSTIQYTENLRARIPHMLDAFSISSVFDAPCGDFNWMKEVLRKRRLKYIGADIVKPIIELNCFAHATSNKEFYQLDVIKGPFPDADMWLCRDCFFHLTEQEIFLALQNFMASNIRFLFTTTHLNKGSFSNTDLSAAGGFRLFDLLSVPYNFPPPLHAIDDWIPGYPPRIMGLWSKEQVGTALLAGLRTCDVDTLVKR